MWMCSVPRAVRPDARAVLFVARGADTYEVAAMH